VDKKLGSLPSSCFLNKPEYFLRRSFSCACPSDALLNNRKSLSLHFLEELFEEELEEEEEEEEELDDTKAFGFSAD
jgi:hypothetical protein